MFFFVAIGVLAVVHLYLWKRLVLDTTRAGTPARRVATAVLATLALLMVAALALGTRVDPDIARWFTWPGYLWLAIFFYLVLTLLVLELPRLALVPWTRKLPASADSGPASVDADPASVSRRVALARGAAAVAGLTAASLVGYGTTVALGPPTITRVPITLRRLDPRAAGCRIALISDLHLGPILGRSFTERIVDLVNAERPDVVALAGDLVDGDVADLADAAAPLARLRSSYGTFYVTGNHEYYVGYRQWVEYVPSLGIRPLRNERVEISHNGGVFDLAGINDATGYQWQDAGDVGEAVAGRDPSRAVVLVAHQPVDVRHAVRHDVDLMLAGHTHGGQLSPFELIVNLQQGAVAGFYQVAGTKLYVTRGAGFWGPPVRVGAPPDITVVELRPA
ncbi:putative phosphohydrolase [Saccharomonospora marina XMU15]|uniref:Putative phosphohydrolase n=1 Tax=Saccharomonospora marina XMU15 TaxID=882083 RepID=H5X533_9PSEU|nr:metallophosphoesterase [Saccharomonospora marina]EHR53365.1 putative phosphohydrolase [Saccharomonospora marina XMU15]